MGGAKFIYICYTVLYKINVFRLSKSGVTDMVFNPVIAVYEMVLKTPDGKRVSPAYWDQKTSDCIDEYWEFKEN